ncbi:copper chaperone [Burkholderia sp. WP9]|uniref:copper chaperone n=1 Tax=Burkholderia sp. WP9 TaxID=1500263 RepID=UPI002570EA8E|nr:copper chaperone [Burkholderia sp. WP9]
MKGDNDAAVLTRAMRTVEPDAKVDVDVDARTVKVDSWLFAEEFLVAFVDAGYDVKLVER